LSEHANFARAQGVSEVVRALNGDIVLLAAGEAGIVGQVDHGRLYKDGDILLPTGDDCIAQRRRLSFSGVVSIALALSPKGDLSGDPDVMIAGLPNRTRDGGGMDDLIDSAIFETFENLPRGKRRDADAVSTAIERAVRNAVNSVWGKKPAVHVLVVEV
jgi:ribonuclease J